MNALPSPDPAASGADEAPAAAAPASRIRRPELARTAPLRHPGTLLRDGTREAPAQAAGVPPSEDPVARGVRLGYQVIEEQILQGQKLAQRLGSAAARLASPIGRRDGAAGGTGAAAGAGDAAGDAQALLDRVVHLYRDVGALCVDALETVARNPLLRAGMTRFTPGDAAARSAAATAAAAGAGDAARDGDTAATDQGYVVEVRSRRRVRVALEMRRRGAPDTAPRVHALHALAPGAPPVAGVRFADGVDGDPVLQVDIDDAQPAGTYSGVVVDASTNVPCGTLSVVVLP